VLILRHDPVQTAHIDQKAAGERDRLPVVPGPGAPQRDRDAQPHREREHRTQLVLVGGLRDYVDGDVGQRLGQHRRVPRKVLQEPPLRRRIGDQMLRIDDCLETSDELGRHAASHPPST
jgi:hypothetical protein